MFFVFVQQEELSRKRKAPVASSVVRVNRAADEDSDDVEEEETGYGGRGVSSRVSLPSKPERKSVLTPHTGFGNITCRDGRNKLYSEIAILSLKIMSQCWKVNNWKCCCQLLTWCNNFACNNFGKLSLKLQTTDMFLGFSINVVSVVSDLLFLQPSKPTGIWYWRLSLRLRTQSPKPQPTPQVCSTCDHEQLSCFYHFLTLTFFPRQYHRGRLFLWHLVLVWPAVKRWLQPSSWFRITSTAWPQGFLPTTPQNYLLREHLVCEEYSYYSMWSASRPA